MPVAQQSVETAKFSSDMRKVLSSKDLFEGEREIQISHNDDVYRLTITKLGKLILTK